MSLQTVQHNGFDQDPYTKEFGINIDSKLASIEARVLPAPWVMLKSLLILVFSLYSNVNSLHDLFSF